MRLLDAANTHTFILVSEQGSEFGLEGRAGGGTHLLVNHLAVLEIEYRRDIPDHKAAGNIR